MIVFQFQFEIVISKSNFERSFQKLVIGFHLIFIEKASRFFFHEIFSIAKYQISGFGDYNM